MNDPEPNPAQKRISISTLLLWIVVTYLAVTTFQLRQQLAEQGAVPASGLPIDAAVVAKQFENQTTIDPIKTKVKSVRYSPSEDAYMVRCFWDNDTTGKTWSTDARLKANGYGQYFGTIASKEFLAPLGYKQPFTVSIESPAPFSAEEK